MAKKYFKNYPGEFQSAHPHGVRLYMEVELPFVALFQSAHPHGVRLIEALASVVDDEFQSAHPHGVRFLSKNLSAPPSAGFNPRTRMGCDARGKAKVPVQDGVSIRAPAWGAIELSRILRQQASVSIRAPAWGAIMDRLGGSIPYSRFNPRTRMGCDLSASTSTWL